MSQSRCPSVVFSRLCERSRVTCTCISSPHYGELADKKPDLKSNEQNTEYKDTIKVSKRRAAAARKGGGKDEVGEGGRSNPLKLSGLDWRSPRGFKPRINLIICQVINSRDYYDSIDELNFS